MELCPICIDKEATVFTECNHGYCVCCISRIKKCSMCRKPLLHNELCNEIICWHSKKNNASLVSEERNNSDSGINVYNFALNDPLNYQPSGYVDFNRLFSGEINMSTRDNMQVYSFSDLSQASDYYSFYISPENHRPSGTGGGSRITD